MYRFMPYLEEEAVTMMDNIIPSLKHLYGRTVCKYFDTAAVEACSKDKWDSATKRVICETDINLESVLMI